MLVVESGAEERQIRDATGQSVQTIWRDHKALMNISRDATAQVDGRPVGRDYCLGPHDRTLGFAKVWGFKGVGRYVWTQEGWCQMFQASPEELQHQIDNGLKVLRFSDGQVRVTETAMDEHIARQNGHESPVALGERLYDPKDAAPLLKLNVQTVRQHIKNGKLGGMKDESGRWWVRQQDIERYLDTRKLIHGD